MSLFFARTRIYNTFTGLSRTMKKCSTARLNLIQIVSWTLMIQTRPRLTLGNSYSGTEGEYAQVRQRGIPLVYIHYYAQGAHFAELSIFLSITGILAMFNIRKQNQDGVEITPKFEFTTGITRYDTGLHPLL